MRIDYGPGYRIYSVQRGKTVVILLCGGHKRTQARDIARSKGMTDIAKAAGLARSNLYKALSPDGNPEFSTVAHVLKALGLRLSVARERVTRRQASPRRGAGGPA